jgi:molybdenum cofactor cytidylyltransferase
MPTSPEGGVVILLLAAGSSSRMGEPKMLLPLDGEPLVRRSARRGLESGADEVVAVIPPGDAAIRSALDGLVLTIAERSSTNGPISDSIHAGLDAVRPDTTAVVILLADMVHVTSAMLREIVVAARAPDTPIVVSCYGDVNAPPLAFPHRLFPELRTATGDAVGKEVVARHRDEVRVLHWPPEALRDVDTPADYRDALLR